MTTDLRLPRREEGIKLLRLMPSSDVDGLLDELLDALWDAHRSRTLPEELHVLLLDWLAHAHFEASPIVKERLALIEKRLGSEHVVAFKGAER